VDFFSSLPPQNGKQKTARQAGFAIGSPTLAPTSVGSATNTKALDHCRRGALQSCRLSRSTAKTPSTVIVARSGVDFKWCRVGDLMRVESVIFHLTRIRSRPTILFGLFVCQSPNVWSERQEDKPTTQPGDENTWLIIYFAASFPISTRTCTI
jgi:hypothetical protein